jgi:hypothetical protein
VSYKFLYEKPSVKETPNEEQKHYFCPVSVIEWTNSRCPCLPIQIGDKTILSLLDLGFTGYFSISKEILDQISDKTYLVSQTTYGFKGNGYESKNFSVPKVRIDNTVSFYDVPVQEETEQFNIDARVIREDGITPSSEAGKIGWKIFKLFNLFLDLGNDTIVFCDSLSTLEQQGYAVSTFTKTPLTSERGLIEMEAETSNGHLLCVLDTGSTCNILNEKSQKDTDTNELVFDPKDSFEMPSFTIDEKEFGPLAFRRIPIELPIHVEAILGMDFFKKNMVFLDFTNNLIYLAPSVKNKEGAPLKEAVIF